MDQTGHAGDYADECVHSDGATGQKAKRRRLLDPLNSKHVSCRDFGHMSEASHDCGHTSEEGGCEPSFGDGCKNLDENEDKIKKG